MLQKDVEKNAKEFAQVIRQRKELHRLYQHPTGLPSLGFTYKKCKDNEINLGLDLKGGMNVTMEVSLVDLIRSMSNYSTDATFNKALENAQAAQANSTENFVKAIRKRI
ncbi:MAG: hypothetical protein IPN88_04645 [Bacteroidetes bacterium]|nr:hypothetical protein [Bacteroidota bacterium]